MTDPRRTARNVGLAVTLAFATVAFVYTWLESYAPLRALRLARATGWLAAALLTLALCVTPLKTLRERRGTPRSASLVALRRSLGLAAATCAFIHAAYALLALRGLPGLVLSVPWLRAGLAALAVLAALFATSFDVVLRSCRLQHWKELHRLNYVVVVLVLLHSVLGPFGSPGLELTFAGAIAVLLTVRVVLARGSRIAN